MDPRYTSIARTPVGLALRCEQCKTEIEEQKVPAEGIALFELVRSALRHLCEDAEPVNLTVEEENTLSQIAEGLQEPTNVFAENNKKLCSACDRPRSECRTEDEPFLSCCSTCAANDGDTHTKEPDGLERD